MSETHTTPKAPTHTVWVAFPGDDENVVLRPTSVFGTLGECRKHCRQSLGTLMVSDIADREYLVEHLDAFFQEVENDGLATARRAFPNLDVEDVADFTTSYDEDEGEACWPLLLVVPF